MTGRKVTRRASMRRKSMRSPSTTRSAGSKTPRSVNSEPLISGDASFNSSSDKLESELAGSMASLPANNSSERLAKAQQQKAVVIENDSVCALSSSEQLANELAAVKIADSKENLAEVAKSESKASLDDLAAKNSSKGSLNDLAKNNNSKGSISDLVKNRSTASLNKSEASVPELNQSTTEIEAEKSKDELVAVSLNEKAEEVVDEKAPAEPVATESSTPAPVESSNSAAVATDKPTEETPAPAAVETEEVKKSCLAQKAAKCRCIIS